MTLNRLVLPAPLGPMMAVMSRGAENDTLRSTFKPPNVRLMFSAAMAEPCASVSERASGSARRAGAARIVQRDSRDRRPAAIRRRANRIRNRPGLAITSRFLLTHAIFRRPLPARLDSTLAYS